MNSVPVPALPDDIGIPAQAHGWTHEESVHARDSSGYTYPVHAFVRGSERVRDDEHALRKKWPAKALFLGGPHDTSTESNSPLAARVAFDVDGLESNYVRTDEIHEVGPHGEKGPFVVYRPA